jgi:hypothetical protein
MTTTTNVFPIGSTVTLTTSISNDSTQVNGDVVASFPGGGDVDVRLGSVIAAGTYDLVDNPFPPAGDALLTFIPISGSNYKSTSGTLYITETSTQWILEWCSINCNSLAGSTIISTSSTGSFVITK